MKTTIDQAAARELELYTENTRRIYDAYTVPTTVSYTHLDVYKRQVLNAAKGSAVEGLSQVAVSVSAV